MLLSCTMCVQTSRRSSSFFLRCFKETETKTCTVHYNFLIGSSEKVDHDTHMCPYNFQF